METAGNAASSFRRIPYSRHSGVSRTLVIPAQAGIQEFTQDYPRGLIPVRGNSSSQWVCLRFEGRALRERVKATGAQRDPDRLPWLTPLNRAQVPGLEERIVGGA